MIDKLAVFGLVVKHSLEIFWVCRVFQGVHEPLHCFGEDLAHVVLVVLYVHHVPNWRCSLISALRLDDLKSRVLFVPAHAFKWQQVLQLLLLVYDIFQVFVQLHLLAVLNVLDFLEFYVFIHYVPQFVQN